MVNKRKKYKEGGKNFTRERWAGDGNSWSCAGVKQDAVAVRHVAHHTSQDLDSSATCHGQVAYAGL